MSSDIEYENENENDNHIASQVNELSERIVSSIEKRIEAHEEFYNLLVHLFVMINHYNKNKYIEELTVEAADLYFYSNLNISSSGIALEINETIDELEIMRNTFKELIHFSITYSIIDVYRIERHKLQRKSLIQWIQTLMLNGFIPYNNQKEYINRVISEFRDNERESEIGIFYRDIQYELNK
jgi:phosphoribosyl-ATP pyrophosphohydrolase